MDADVKKCTRRNLDIYEFFTTFDSVVSEKQGKDLKLEFDSRQQIPRMVNLSAPILRQLVQIYTPDVFYMFHKEWDFQFCVMLTQRDEKGPLYKYIAHMIDVEGEWRVEFKPDTHEISCTCGTFESLGILCCHALKVYEVNDVKIMPTQYIMERWTRRARSEVAYDDKRNEIQVDQKLEIPRRYRQLVQNIERLAEKAAKSHESYERVRRLIIELEKKFSNDDEDDVPEPSRAPVVESQNIPKGFKKREGRKGKQGWKGRNLKMRRQLTKEPEGVQEASSSKKRIRDSKNKDTQVQAVMLSTKPMQTQDSTSPCLAPSTH